VLARLTLTEIKFTNFNERRYIMKSIKTNTIIMILSIIAFVGFGAYAFADWGMGYGRQGIGMYGQGMGFGGQGYPSNLSEDEIRKLDQERIDPVTKMRKINPNAARSFDRSGSMGFGMMGSGMRGPGGFCNW
jgi:hypothetical protein